MRRILIFVLMLMVPAAPAVANWTGKGELGLVFARGNTDSDTVNARLELLYEHNEWSNETIVRGVHSSDGDETTASRYVFSNKTDYDFSEYNYAWGALRYDRDRFATFKYQASAAVGFGRYLIKDEHQQLVGEIGPGFKYSEARETGQSESEAMLRGYVKYTRTLSETADLSNRLLVEATSEATFAENELALDVAINRRVSLKAGIAVRHTTDVDPGLEKTDTLTTLNLVYNFRQ